MIRERVIIIGCGPAGIACAIQLTRMGLHPLVIEKNAPGGMLLNANLVENYPGFPGGIKGEALAGLFARHLKKFRIKVVRDEAKWVTYAENQFSIFTVKGHYTSPVLVLASGTAPLYPEEYPPDLFASKYVHTDIQAIVNESGRNIGIIGAGDAAFDYAIHLAEKGNQVHIFNRGGQAKALKLLVERAAQNNAIAYHQHFRLIRVKELPESGIRAVFEDNTQKKVFILDCLIFATGRTPALDFLDETVLINMNRLAEQHQLYLIGDAKNGNIRQVSVAVGDGVRAAMEIMQHESNQQD